MAVKRGDVGKYLDNKRCVLWGRAFDISKDTTPAVDFVVELLRDLGVKVK